LPLDPQVGQARARESGELLRPFQQLDPVLRGWAGVLVEDGLGAVPVAGDEREEGNPLSRVE
jgi:hypothetical protein